MREESSSRVKGGASTADLRVEQTTTGRITAQGKQATGIYALHDGSGQVDTVVRGSLKVQGEEATGVLTNVNAPLSNARATILIDQNASVEAEGDFAYAAWMYHEGTGEASIVSAGLVKATGDGANGLNVYTDNPDHSVDAYVHVQSGQVQVSGAGVRGVTVKSAGASRLQTIVSSGAAVQATGVDAIGVEVAGRAAGGSAGRAQVQAQINGTVTASDEFGVGAATLTDEGTATRVIGKDGRITGGWQADAASTSAQHSVAAAGVAISSNRAATLVNAGRIEAGSDRAVVDTAYYNKGVSVGNLTLHNSGTLTGFIQLGAGGQNTVFNEAGGQLALRHFADTDGDGARDTKRVAVSDFGAPTSRFDNQAGATVRLAAVGKAGAMDATGFYTPSTGAGSTALPADVYDMTREGIVQAQMVNLGEFNHAGTIDLRGSAIGNTLVMTGAPDAVAGPGAGVFVSNGGRLRLRAGARSTAAPDSTDRYADMLIVDSTRLGKGGPTQIHVDYDPADLGHLTVGNGIEVVEVRDKAASAKGVFALGNVVAAGAYAYVLNHGGVGADADDGNWYLRNYVKLSAGSGKDKDVPNYRKEVPLAMAAPSVAHRLGLDLLGTYHDRAGEDYVMLAPGSAMQGYAGPREDDKRAWGRVFGNSGKVRDGGNGAASRYDSFRKNGPRYDYDLSGVQFGMDLYRRLYDDGSRNMAGAYLSASHASARVDAVLGGRAGKLSMDGYSLGGYWTRMGQSRWYADAVAQVTRYDGVRMRSDNGHTIRSDGWGLAASLEAGRPFMFNDKWTLEPQAQLVYQRVSLDATRDRYGNIRFGSTDGLYGRLGARLARNWEGSDGREYGVWARVNVWHDFGARAKTTFSTPDGHHPVTLRTGLGGTWGQLGVGFSVQLQDNLNAFIAADYEQSLERSKTQGVSGRIGIQYVW